MMNSSIRRRTQPTPARLRGPGSPTNRREKPAFRGPRGVKPPLQFPEGNGAGPITLIDRVGVFFGQIPRHTPAAFLANSRKAFG